MHSNSDLDTTIQLSLKKQLILNGGHKSQVWSVDFSPDNSKVISGGQDGIIKIWDIQSQNCISNLIGHTLAIYCVSYSHNGQLIASCGKESRIKIWNAETSQCLYTIQAHTKIINSIKFLDSENILLSCSDDQTIKLWYIDNQQCIVTLNGHSAAVISASFSPDGNSIVSCSWDQTIKVWDIASEKCTSTITPSWMRSIYSAKFTPDGKYIVACGQAESIGVWNLKSGKLDDRLKGHSHTIYSISFSLDGKYLVSGSWDQTVKIWDYRSSKCLHTIEGHDHYIYSVAISPNNKYIASCGEDKTIRISSFETQQSLSRLTKVQDLCIGIENSIQITSDYKTLITQTYAGSIKMWDLITGTFLKEMKLKKHEIHCLNQFHNGSVILLLTKGNEVSIWNLEQSQMVFTIQLRTNQIEYACISQGDKFIAISFEQSIQIWDIHTQKFILEIFCEVSKKTQEMQFYKNNKKIFFKDEKFVSVVDLKTRKVYNRFNNRNIFSLLWTNGAVTQSFIVTADGQKLILQKDSNFIEIWNLKTMRCLVRRLNNGHSLIKEGIKNNFILSCGSTYTELRIWKLQHSRPILSQQTQKIDGGIDCMLVKGQKCILGNKKQQILVYELNY